MHQLLLVLVTLLLIKAFLLVVLFLFLLLFKLNELSNLILSELLLVRIDHIIIVLTILLLILFIVFDVLCTSLNVELIFSIFGLIFILFFALHVLLVRVLLHLIVNYKLIIFNEFFTSVTIGIIFFRLIFELLFITLRLLEFMVSKKLFNFLFGIGEVSRVILLLFL